MTREEVRDEIYRIWMEKRPRPTRISDLHKSYRVAKEEYAVLRTSDYLSLLKEARYIGGFLSQLGEEMPLPASLESERKVLEALLGSIDEETQEDE